MCEDATSNHSTLYQFQEYCQTASPVKTVNTLKHSNMNNKTVNTVEDCQESLRLSQKLQTSKSVSDCQDNHSKSVIQ